MVYLIDKLNLMQPIRFLTGTEMTRIHQSALRILECTGMTIDHVKALEYLRQSGCYVDMVKRHVLFPPAVVEAVVVQMKANFADPNRRPKRMSVRYSQIHFGREPFQVHGDFSVSAGGFCCFIWDLDGKRR